MERISSLNLSFDRVLLHWIIPGFCAVAPWINTCSPILEKVRNMLADSNISIVIFLLIITSVVVGLLINILGSYIEVKYFDKRLEKTEDETFVTTWQNFLSISYTHEPIGQRYLREVLMGMKFELSFGISLILASVGIYNLLFDYGFIESFCQKVMSIGIPIAFGLILIREAYSSAKSLCRIRKNLVKHYYRSPEQINQPNPPK